MCFDGDVCLKYPQHSVSENFQCAVYNAKLLLIFHVHVVNVRTLYVCMYVCMYACMHAIVLA